MSKWTPEMEEEVSDRVKIALQGDTRVVFRPVQMNAALAELRRLRDTVKTLSIALDLAIMTRPEGGRNE